MRPSRWPVGSVLSENEGREGFFRGGRGEGHMGWEDVCGEWGGTLTMFPGPEVPPSQYFQDELLYSVPAG